MTEIDLAIHTLLGRIAHDLKNPLAVVSSNLHYLGEELADAGQLEAVQESVLSLERATRMLDDVVDLGRMRAGRLTPASDRLTLAELEQPVRQAVAAQLGRRTLLVDLPSINLRTDRGLLLRALVSLVEHGVRHTPVGRPVELRARREPQRLVVELLDGGPPFDPAVPPTLLCQDLTPHARTEERWRSDQGLALTFVGTVVRALGGSAQVLPRDDAQPGVRFQIELPVEFLA